MYQEIQGVKIYKLIRIGQIDFENL